MIQDRRAKNAGRWELCPVMMKNASSTRGSQKKQGLDQQRWMRIALQGGRRYPDSSRDYELCLSPLLQRGGMLDWPVELCLVITWHFVIFNPDTGNPPTRSPRQLGKILCFQREAVQRIKQLQGTVAELHRSHKQQYV